MLTLLFATTSAATASTLYQETTTLLDGTQESVHIEIRYDGYWRGANGDVGWLAADELVVLRKAIEDTAFKVGYDDMLCDALALSTWTISSPALEAVVSWDAPCGATPHESVYALRRLVEQLAD